ncbi:putative intracellular protease/amidase [Kribbella amoyensis]|uniref:Putative intracellular protease/amidase n=1 Tax=Kribbella amoyensis TaxID=996641 RepID=A0A561BX83_9ACTN|nr:DJ-1/PfpI family protein [Kribbella amoyensis]TWD83506.1 putative intracellular protease/amidase [Kribbella amoyensis]
MTENTLRTVHVAVYDTLADWEIGFVTAHVNSPAWHRTPGRFAIRTVGATDAPVTTMGGLRVLPDLTLDALTPADSAMLILPGNELFATEAYHPYLAKAREFRAAGVPVAAICGATGGLALAGLLDDHEHTSNAAEFLNGLGYGGAHLYRDEPAVNDRGLITGAAQAPIEFARAIFAELGIYEPGVLDSWYKLYGRQDPAGFYELMSA